MAQSRAGLVHRRSWGSHRLHTRAGDHQATPRVPRPSHWTPGPAQPAKSKFLRWLKPLRLKENKMGMWAQPVVGTTNLGKELPPPTGRDHKKEGKRNRSETTGK